MNDTELRARIDSLRVPINKPFDHHVMRPERGRAEVVLPGGLEIVVLGPALDRLKALHEFSTHEAEQRGGTLDRLLGHDAWTTRQLDC